VSTGPSGVPFVDVLRGPLIESVHALAACALDPAGRELLVMGDVDVPVYLRSSAKPFIAGAIVASGAAERYAFDARELAVIAASHGGEPFHVAAVRSILAKIGLDESALQCGAHPPSYEPAARALAAAGEAPSALHNNCSGKHSGILALCRHLGLEHADYLALEHPAQQRILAFCARLTGDDPANWPVGVDGCGIPVFATSLRRAALAFARFATLAGLTAEDARALRIVRDAMAAEPAYVAGTGRFDTALMSATHAAIVCKGGAEGVHCSALVRDAAGLALKVVDGNARAAAPAALAFLGTLGALEPAERAALAAFAEPPVRNVAGRVVGRIVARADTISGPAAS
jgi:L-asparaginase II